MSRLAKSVDVLIVGSGPAGSTFAREILEAMPDVKVLMVEIGPRLGSRVGMNVRNLPPRERVEAQHLAEVSAGYGNGSSSATGMIGDSLAARPGTALLRPDRPMTDPGMPAAALAANVGGMAAHWTCACPAPGDSERIPFLESEFDDAYARAVELLEVRTDAFPPSVTGEHLLTALGEMFDEGRTDDRRVQRMPLACSVTGDGRPSWSGTDTILGTLGSGVAPNFRLADRMLCRRLTLRGDAITEAEVVDLRTGETTNVGCRFVVVAADSLRTPQLLWASGIRPTALGHYLNDHPQLVSAIALRDDLVEGDGRRVRSAPVAAHADELTGVLWVPFVGNDKPSHTQVMQLGATSVTMNTGSVESREVVVYGRLLPKEIRYEDRIEFSEELDGLGMPKLRVTYALTERDQVDVANELELMRNEGSQLGIFLSGEEPRLLPAGSSMHYQGTVRMGEHDDGTSVCGPTSQVWGITNLFVAGNGVIPTATACNPTATSVALAVIAARTIVQRLRHDSIESCRVVAEAER